MAVEAAVAAHGAYLAAVAAKDEAVAAAKADAAEAKATLDEAVAGLDADERTEYEWATVPTREDGSPVVTESLQKRYDDLQERRAAGEEE